MRSKVAFILALTTICAVRAEAHYLWVVIGDEDDGNKVANIYFEESPSPGDGHYLEHFLGTSKTWVRTLAEPEPELIATNEITIDKNRWMRAKLGQADERSVDAYGKFGVYAYGDTNVLLHYYARHLQANTHDGIHELGRAEQMKLDLVPHDSGDELELTLLWQGEPVGDRMVFIRGPQGFRKNLLTDERGRIAFVPKDGGSYTFRSSVEQKTAGEEQGDQYEFVRHNITLVMRLPVGL